MASAHHLCLRIDGEYLAYQVMRTVLQDIVQAATERPWEFTGEEAGERAAWALEAADTLTGCNEEEEEGEGDGT